MRLKEHPILECKDKRKIEFLFEGKVYEGD